MKKVLLAICFGVSLVACGQQEGTSQVSQASSLTPDQQLAVIDSLEAALFPKGFEAGTDSTRAFPFVRAVQQFAESNKAHPRVPDLLMKAAGVGNGTGWGNKSIQLWGYVWRWFPEYPRAAEALFYQGYVMDTQYEDYALAVEYYDRFLAKFPDHQLAEQVLQLKEVAKAGGTLPPVPEAPNN